MKSGNSIRVDPPAYARNDRDSGGATVLMPRIESALKAELRRLPELLAGPCERVCSGGKRLRPLLLVKAAACAGVRPPHAGCVPAAVAVELLHLATLVHDDLMEDARIRRSVPTINAAEGTGVAVLAGDALLGAAGRLAAGLSRSAGVLLQQALVDLCAGQALEEQLRFRAEAGTEDVLAVARGKSGSLTRLACQLAAAVSPAMDPDLAVRLAAFGQNFGVCLQVADDVLDLVASTAMAGKPVGVDFPAGTLTLPAVFGLRRNEELRRLLRPGLDSTEQARALHLLRHSGGIAASVGTAHRLAGHACASLSAVADRGHAAAIAHLSRLPERYLISEFTKRVDPSRRSLLSQHPLVSTGTGAC